MGESQQSRRPDEATGVLARWKSQAGFVLLVDRQQRLKLRLQTDAGGWHHDLGPLPETPFHLALAYTPGRLRVWVGGRLRLLSHDPRGTLSGWRDGDLEVGPWAGRAEGLLLHARQLEAPEIESSRLAYLPRIWERKPLPILRVEAQLTSTPALPPPGAYPQTLVVYQYRLLQTLEGPPPQEPLRVVHWGILNGEVQPAAERQVGSTYSMRLELYDDHPQLHGLRKLDDDPSPAPLYVEVAL